MTSDEAIEYGKRWDAALEAHGDSEQSNARVFLAWALLSLKERKTGRWIPQYVTEPHWTGFAISCYKCSCCEHYNIPSYRSEYCPNCGAKMEVEK